MSTPFQAERITDDVYWVGAIDRELRSFHGYETGRGSTYNAYLVLAEKVALIDTVKAPFFDEMMARIASVIDPQRIDYIVSNHSEMDHSGALGQTISTVEPTKVFASKMGAKALAAHFHLDREIVALADGESLDLGSMNLTCAETRMCHWPDSMVSYLHDRELLFSQDAFGMHLASDECFVDELDREILDYEAAKYYANILLPLSSFVRKALDKLAGMDLPLSMVAPDHGPIWRNQADIEGILADYGRWAAQAPTNKSVIVYDTMWGATAQMARAIGEGLTAGGAEVKLMHMSDCHRSDVALAVLEAGALIVGSPTMNNNMFPTVGDVMTYLKGLRPANLLAGAFGSYGWSGEAPKILLAMLEDMALTPAAVPLRVRYVPDEEALGLCRQFGEQLAGKLREFRHAE